jgi:hypothetical protein
MLLHLYNGSFKGCFTPEGTMEGLLDSLQPGRRLRIDLSPRPDIPHSLAPGSQTVCDLPSLEVSVALRHVHTFPWAPNAWREIRQHIRPWLLVEQNFPRLAGYFNWPLIRSKHAGPL